MQCISLTRSVLLAAALPSAFTPTSLAGDGGTPFLAAASFFGGSGHEEGHSISLSPDGSIYIAGHTVSNGLPNALNSLSGSMDTFVMKVSADLSTVFWSRYVGGVGEFHHIEYAADCAATADGGVVVVGRTETDDFPTVNALDATLGGERDAVLFRLDADGEIVFSTYIGGSDDDGGDSDDDNYGEVEVAPDGSIFIAGFTRSPDFPLVNPIDGTFGGFQADVYVMKITADGQTILASTYLGDEFRDQVFGMALDAQGRPVIIGDAGPGWPYTPGAYSFGTPSSNGIVYVTKLADDAQSIVWSARVDRVDDSGGHLAFTELAIAPDDTITVVGDATGGGFPVPADAYQPDVMPGSPTRDAVALAFSADGTSIVGGTFLGAMNIGEVSRAVGIDSFGHVLMAVNIVTSPPNPARLYKFDAAMTMLLEDPILLANPGETRTLRVDGNNDAYVLLHNGPTTPGAFLETNPGGTTPYLAHWDMQDPPNLPGDLDGDGSVGFNDLLILLAAWGPCDPPPAECIGDIDGDGTVGFSDLISLLSAWGMSA